MVSCADYLAAMSQDSLGNSSRTSSATPGLPWQPEPLLPTAQLRVQLNAFWVQARAIHQGFPPVFALTLVDICFLTKQNADAKARRNDGANPTAATTQSTSNSSGAVNEEDDDDANPPAAVHPTAELKAHVTWLIDQLSPAASLRQLGEDVNVDEAKTFLVQPPKDDVTTDPVRHHHIPRALSPRFFAQGITVDLSRRALLPGDYPCLGLVCRGNPRITALDMRSTRRIDHRGYACLCRILEDTPSLVRLCLPLDGDDGAMEFPAGDESNGKHSRTVAARSRLAQLDRLLQRNARRSLRQQQQYVVWARKQSILRSIDLSCQLTRQLLFDEQMTRYAVHRDCQQQHDILLSEKMRHSKQQQAAERSRRIAEVIDEQKSVCLAKELGFRRDLVAQQIEEMNGLFVRIGCFGQRDVILFGQFTARNALKSQEKVQWVEARRKEKARFGLEKQARDAIATREVEGRAQIEDRVEPTSWKFLLSTIQTQLLAGSSVARRRRSSTFSSPNASLGK